MRPFVAVLGLCLVSLAGTSPTIAAASASDAASADPGTEACFPGLTPGHHELSLVVGGMPRRIIVEVPKVAAGVRPPAVIAFHGYNAHADQLEATSGLSTLADEHGFVVAYPQALDEPPAWAYTDTSGTAADVDFADALMDDLVARACADPDRLVLVGHSMGGGMASDAACRLSHRVAGAVLVAPLWLQPPCRPTRPVPIVVTHALDDPVLPYAGGLVPGFGPDGPMQLPVEEAVATWAAWDGCGDTPQLDESADGSAVLTWPDCRAPVVLHRLASGGHQWPGLAAGLVVDVVATTTTS